jgi:hypothetical protein
MPTVESLAKNPPAGILKPDGAARLGRDRGSGQVMPSGLGQLTGIAAAMM